MGNGQSVKVRLTKHAREKFELLKRYGFALREEDVVNTVLNPERLERKGTLRFAMRSIDPKRALRVVYEERRGYLLVITFYPERRKSHGL